MDVKDTLNLVIAFIALVVSGLTFLYAYKTNNEFGNKESIQNLKGLFFEKY